MEDRHYLSEARPLPHIKDVLTWEVDIMREGVDPPILTLEINEKNLPPRRRKKKVVWKLPDSFDQPPKFSKEDQKRILELFKDRKKELKRQRKSTNFGKVGSGGSSTNSGGVPDGSASSTSTAATMETTDFNGTILDDSNAKVDETKDGLLSSKVKTLPLPPPAPPIISSPPPGFGMSELSIQDNPPEDSSDTNQKVPPPTQNNGKKKKKVRARATNKANTAPQQNGTSPATTTSNTNEVAQPSRPLHQTDDHPGKQPSHSTAPPSSNDSSLTNNSSSSTTTTNHHPESNPTNHLHPLKNEAIPPQHQQYSSQKLPSAAPPMPPPPGVGMPTTPSPVLWVNGTRQFVLPPLAAAATTLAQVVTETYFTCLNRGLIQELAAHFVPMRSQKSLTVGGAHAVCHGPLDMVQQLQSLTGMVVQIKGALQQTSTANSIIIVATGICLSPHAGLSFCHTLVLVPGASDGTGGTGYQIHNDALCFLTPEQTAAP